ncbi:MAG: tRNA threonylcarbamoyladenosine dehydratase [Spirochaetota bacterium]
MVRAFSRTELLLGAEAMACLEASTVAIFGIGGVGSWAAEALARAGVGGFVLVDDDAVCITNINRQLVALRATVGRPKVEVMAERILAINPKAKVSTFQEYYCAESGPRLLQPGISYVVDAIDTITAKVDLISRSQAMGIPLMSSLGAASKLDPTRLEVTDISLTSICPFARIVRKELRRVGITSLKVVYSREPPIKANEADNPCRSDCVCPKKDRVCTAKRSIPGTSPFVPPVAGFIIAAEVVKDLIGSRR